MLVSNGDILKYKIDTLDNYSKNWTQTDPVSDELELTITLSRNMPIHIDLIVGITG